MPRTFAAQKITFELEDVSREQWVDAQVVPARNTVAKIASFHDVRGRVGEIKERNNIHSAFTKLKRSTIKVPSQRTVVGGVLKVFAGDGPPVITGGYAKYDMLDRPGRTGLTHFLGYDPITMDVPIRFEWTTVNSRGEPEGADIEEDIALLERMGGRGVGSMNGVGRPGRVRVKTLDGVVAMPLIPSNYQPSSQNPNPPAWVVSDIAWDENPWRNKAGNRIRQLAVVSLTQYVSPVAQGPLSVTDRSRRRALQPSWRWNA
jgi:hypothetical protein